MRHARQQEEQAGQQPIIVHTQNLLGCLHMLLAESLPDALTGHGTRDTGLGKTHLTEDESHVNSSKNVPPKSMRSHLAQ